MLVGPCWLKAPQTTARVPPPNAAAAETYASGYATYTQLYPALKHIYTQL